MSLDRMPPHQHTKHWNKLLQWRLVIVRVRTGLDLLGIPGGHGYSRSAREPQPVGDRCCRVRRNMDTVESRRNGPQLYTSWWWWWWWWFDKCSLVHTICRNALPIMFCMPDIIEVMKLNGSRWPPYGATSEPWGRPGWCSRPCLSSLRRWWWSPSRPSVNAMLPNISSISRTLSRCMLQSPKHITYIISGE